MFGFKGVMAGVKATIERNKWIQYSSWVVVLLLIVVAKLYEPATNEQTVEPNLPKLEQAAIVRPVVFPVEVERVIDGDTILASGVRYRLAGIDAPELSQEFGQEAKEFLEALLASSDQITVEVEGVDRYGRSLAHVFVSGINVSEILLENGFAHVFYTENKKQNEHFKKLVDFAKKGRAGLWFNPDAVNPYEYRMAN